MLMSDLTHRFLNLYTYFVILQDKPCLHFVARKAGVVFFEPCQSTFLIPINTAHMDTILY